MKDSSKQNLNHHNRFLVPSMYVNIKKDGTFGYSVMLIVKRYKNKEDVKKILDVEDNLVFEKKADIDDASIHLFLGKRNTSVISMQDINKGNVYVGMKVVPMGTWDSSKSNQIKTLRSLKDCLMAEIIGVVTLSSKILELDIISSPPYSYYNGNKMFFKKINSDIVIKSRRFISS